MTAVRVWKGLEAIRPGDVYEAKDVPKGKLGWLVQRGTIKDPGIHKDVEVIRFIKPIPIDTSPLEQGNVEGCAQEDTSFSVVVPTSAISKGIPTYLGISAKILSGSEVYLIAGALRVAAEIYKQDAIAATVRHSLMLAEQFEQQASRSLAMAEYLEMCDQVEVRSGKL